MPGWPVVVGKVASAAHDVQPERLATRLTRTVAAAGARYARHLDTPPGRATRGLVGPQRSRRVANQKNGVTPRNPSYAAPGAPGTGQGRAV